jgi:hypothetical protein
MVIVFIRKRWAALNSFITFSDQYQLWLLNKTKAMTKFINAPYHFLFLLFSLSQNQRSWLDLNPQTWNVEASVLPAFKHLSKTTFYTLSIIFFALK